MTTQLAEQWDLGQVFKPIKYDHLTLLFDEYTKVKSHIQETFDFLQRIEGQRVLHYFQQSAKRREEARYPVPLDNLEGAFKALDAEFWQKAFLLTDLQNAMPEKRRDEWRESIEKHEVPEFTEEIVMNTFAELLEMRSQFFAERVDGIFTNLSRQHVTNKPQAFSERMIIGYVYNEYSTATYRNAGYIHDFRCVVAQILGREQPHYNSTHVILNRVREETGVWHYVDGDAFRIRVYKKGTAHLEVNPDLAWKMNQVLAYLHPISIAPEAKIAPKKRSYKDFNVIQDVLSDKVLDEIGGIFKDRLYGRRPTDSVSTGYLSHKDKHLRQEVESVLKALGCVKQEESTWSFDYDITMVIRRLLVNRCMPNKKSHQYYPTPKPVAQKVFEAADMYPGLKLLEPSAGQGHLAECFRDSNPKCVEISPLHCEILEAKGFDVDQADFLKWKSKDKFDRIVMNPPFSERRAERHVLKAWKHLQPGGKLVAVLPESFKDKMFWGDILAEVESSTISPTLQNEFENTSVNVVILSLKKKATQ